MPAAMMHGGGGVMLMMMTKIASQKTIKKYKITNKCNQSPIHHNHIQLKTTTQNHKQKQPRNKHPAP